MFGGVVGGGEVGDGVVGGGEADGGWGWWVVWSVVRDGWVGDAGCYLSRVPIHLPADLFDATVNANESCALMEVRAADFDRQHLQLRSPSPPAPRPPSSSPPPHPLMRTLPSLFRSAGF